MNKLFQLSLILTMLYSITACSGNLLPVRSIYNSNQCAVMKPGITRLHTQQELEQVINTHQFNFSEQQARMPHPDFNKESVILLTIGQQNTAGHKIQLTGNQAHIKDDQLVLPISISKPEPGSNQAQVITSPCRIVVVPKSDFSEIILESNQSGN